MTTSSSWKCGVEVLPKRRKNRGTRTVRPTDNILFLDFDGVCNSFEHGSYLTHPPEEYGVDMDIVRRIREICEFGGARIVISSNWRRYDKDGSWPHEGREYRNPLGKLYELIGDLVVGTLTLERHLTKAEALELWFEDNAGFDGKFAILDDDPREEIQNVPFLNKNFWLTDRRYGVTDSIKKDIIKHFRRY